MATARKNRYQTIERRREQTGDIVALAENIELLTGQRGDGRERALTWGDAEDAGMIRLLGSGRGYTGFRPSAGGGGIGGNVSTSAQTPTKPTGVTASGAFTAVYVTWDQPTYSGHSHAEIWRASVDNFGLAVRIGTEVGNVFADPVGMGATFWYWVRFVNINDVIGPIHDSHGAQASTAPNITEIMNQLGEKLNESALAQALNNRINLIDTPATGLLDRLNAEIQARQDGDGQLQTQIESIVLSNIADVYYQPDMPTGSINEDSRWFDTDDGNRPYLYKSGAWVDITDQRILGVQAALVSEQSARISADTAHTESIAAMESLVFDPATGMSAQASAITTLQSSVQSLDNQVTAQTTEISQIQAIVGEDFAALQTIKDVSVGPNGVVAQYFLKTDVGGRVAGYGLINDGATSQFIIRSDTFAVAHPSAPTKYPFIIDGGNIYMDTVLIRDGSIQNAKIQSLTADKIVAGTLDAARIGANSITADKIDSRGLTIRDSLGNIILGSGNNLDWSRVAGAGRPADFATNGFLGAPANLIPDDGFYDPGWWRGNRALTAWPTGIVPVNGAIGEPARNLVINATAGAFDFFSTSWAASANRPYRYRLTMYVSPDFAGHIAPILHVPGVAYALPGNPFSGSYPHYTRDNWGVGWRVVEGVWTTSASYPYLQMRMAGHITAGYVYIYMEVLPVAESFMNQGAFATLSQINGANISTYIAGAAIGRAQIGAAAIGYAQIGDLEVGTLKIQGNAVSVTMGAQNSGWGYVPVTITVSSGDLPPGRTSLPIIVTGSRDSTADLFFDIGVNIGSLGVPGNLVAGLPRAGVSAMTIVYDAAPGTYTFYMYNHGAGGGPDPNCRQQSITATLGKR